MRALRSVAVLLAAVLLATGTAVMSGQPAHAVGLPENVPFQLVNYGSGLCVEVAPDPWTGAYALNGNAIRQRTCNGSDLQKWRVIHAGQGPIGDLDFPFPRQLFMNVATGMCLDLTDGNSANRTPLQQWTCNAGSTAMLWVVFGPTINIDIYRLRNARVSTCVDIDAGSLQDFARVQSYTCTEEFNPAQQFAFVV